MLLTKNSPYIGQPKQITLPLNRCQLATLYRCIELENSDGAAVGFFADLPGFGKTAVLISLIIADKLINKENQTIVVLPQNLLEQWDNEIKKFSGDYLSVKIFNNYSDIVDLNSPEWRHNFQSYDVILTTTMYLQMFQSTLSQHNIPIFRIIYDEIDTSKSLFKNIQIKKKMKSEQKTGIYQNVKENNTISFVWYVSASMKNLIGKDGYLEIGELRLSTTELDQKTVKCDPEFIKECSFSLPEITKQDIFTETVNDKYSSLLSIEQLDNINSLSFNKIQAEYTTVRANDETQIIPMILKDYVDHLADTTKQIADINKRIEQRRLSFDAIKNDLSQLISSEKFYTALVNKFYQVHGVSNYDDFITEYKNYASGNFYTKQKALDKFFDGLKDTDKVIFFSDHTQGLNYVQKVLQEKGIKTDTLGRGNVSEINFALHNYKNGDTTVLFIDSSRDGCGMNLENSTHIVFLHRTNDTLYEQMLGRAQRRGRKGSLQVVTFLNKNEVL